MRMNIDVDFDNVNYDEIEEVEDMTLYDSIDESICFDIEDDKITTEFDIIEE